MSRDTSFVTLVRDELGDALRTAGRYDADGFEFDWIRDDVAALYDGEDEEAISREVLFSGLERPFRENLWSIGAYRGMVHVFEDGVLFLVPTSETAGAFVSFDSEADVSLVSFVERLHDAVET